MTDPPRTHADSYVIVNLRGCGRDVLPWPNDRVMRDCFVGSRLIDRYIRTDVNIFWIHCPNALLWFYSSIVSSFRKLFIRYARAAMAQSHILYIPHLIYYKLIIRLIFIPNANLILRWFMKRMTMTVIRMSSFNLSSRSNSFILCHATLSNVYVNGVERADMCEISLIFELGWQWWYKRGTCTTRIVPCTGWQISPSRHPCPTAVSPCKYIRGWSSHWRRCIREILMFITIYYCMIISDSENLDIF